MYALSMFLYQLYMSLMEMFLVIKIKSKYQIIFKKLLNLNLKEIVNDIFHNFLTFYHLKVLIKNNPDYLIKKIVLLYYSSSACIRMLLFSAGCKT